MSSWGHTIRTLREEELWGHSFDADSGRFVLDRTRPRTCSAPKCIRPIGFEGTYQYVTGRAGRISYARKPLCATHAERFRAKHGAVEIPAEAQSRHASEQAFDDIRDGA